MDDFSYDEEEVEEVWEEDDDDEGFMDSLQASFASFQSLAQERKQQQQQGTGPILSPRRMRVENQFTYETIYSDDDEAEEEEEEEEVIEDVVMEEGEKGQEFEDYEYDDTDDDDDNDEDFLLRVRRQMQQLFQERKAKAVAAASSLVSPIRDDEEYEEQVIERWFGRDTLPDDLEGACRMLIPIVCKNGDEQLDPETMIRRTPLEELYRYLKQHYDYKKDVRHELTEAEQHTIEKSATTTNQHQQTSVADIFLKRSTELAAGAGGRRASEPWSSPQQPRQQLVFLENINDDSRTSITYEEVLETSGGGAQWMEESGLSYVDYVLTESAVLEETMYESEVEEDATEVSEERRYEDDGQVVEETIRDEDDNDDSDEETLLSVVKSVGGALQVGDTNVNKIDPYAGESSSATGDMMIAGGGSKGSSKVSESFAFANLQSRWKTQAVDPDGINRPVFEKPEVNSMSAANNKAKAISNEAVILAEPEDKGADSTQKSQTKSLSSHLSIATKPEMKAHVATDIRTQTKSTPVALLANTGSENPTSTKEIQILNDTAQSTNSSRSTRTEEDFAFSNLRSKWKTASDDMKVSSSRKQGAIPGPSKLPSDNLIGSSKSSISNFRSALGNQESAILHSRTEIAAGKSNKVIVEAALVKHVDSTPSASKDGMVSNELHSVTGRLRSTGKVDHAPQDTISSPVARWKAREATEGAGRNPPREDASKTAKDQPTKLLPSKLPSVEQAAARSPATPVATWKANRAGTVHGDGEVGMSGPSATSKTITSSFVRSSSSNPVAIWKASRAAAVQDIQETTSAKMDVSTNASLASAKPKWGSADKPNIADTPSAKPVAIWKASRAAASQYATKVSTEKADRSSATSIKARWSISGTSAGSIDPVSSSSANMETASPSVGKSKWTPPPGGRSNTSSRFGSPAVTDTVVPSSLSTIKSKWTAPTSASLSPVLADPKRGLEVSPLSRKSTMASEFMRAALNSTKVVTPAAHPGQKKTVSGDTATSSTTTSSSNGVMAPGTSAPKKREPNSKDPYLPTVQSEGMTSMEKQKPSKWKINPQENVEKKTFIPNSVGLAPAASSANPSPASTIATASNDNQKASAQAKAPHSWEHPGLFKKSTSVGDDTTSCKLGSLSSENEPTKKLTSQTVHGVGFKRGTAQISPPSTGVMVPATSSVQPSSPNKSHGGVDGMLSSVLPKTPYSGVQIIDGNDPKSSNSREAEGRLSKSLHSGVPGMGPSGSDDKKNNMLSSRHPTNNSPQGVPKFASKMTTSPWSKAAAVAADPIITNDKSLVTEAGRHKLPLSLGATKETSSDPNVKVIAESSTVDQLNSPTVLKKWTPNGPRVIIGNKDETTPVVGSTQRGLGATMDAVSATTKAMNPVPSVVGSKQWVGGATQDTVARKTQAFGPAFAAVRSKQLATAEATQDNILGGRQAIVPEAFVVERKHWATEGTTKPVVSEKNKAMIPSSTVVGSKQWATAGATKPSSGSEKTEVTVPPSIIAGSKPLAPAGSTKGGVTGTTEATVPSFTVAGSKPWAKVGATKEVMSGTTKAALPASTVAGTKQWAPAGAMREGISGTTKANAPSTSESHAFAPESGAVGSKQRVPAGAANDTNSGATTASVLSPAVAGAKPWATTGATKDAMVPSSTVIIGSKPWATIGATKDTTKDATANATVPSSTVIGSKPWATTGATKDITKDTISGSAKSTVPSSTVIGSKPWSTNGITKESIKDVIPDTTKAPVASSTVIGSKPWATAGATKDTTKDATTNAFVPSSTVIGSKSWATTGATKDTTKAAMSGTTKAPVASSTVIGSKPWAATGATKNAISGTTSPIVPLSTVVASKPWSTTGTSKDAVSETTKSAVPSSMGSKQWSKRGPAEDALAETSNQSVPSSNTVIPPNQNPEEESFAFSNLRSKFHGRVG